MLKRPLLCAALLLLVACGDQETKTPTQPQIVTFTATPESITTSHSVSYNWQVNAAAEATCQLDVDSDGTAEYTPECSAGSQSHTFAKAGSFTASLRVSSNGQSVTARARAVTVSAAPIAFTDIIWQPGTPQPYKVAEGQGIALNGKLYVFGGFDSQKSCCTPTARAYVYDPASSSWQALADLPAMNGTGHGGVTHAGITTDGTDIFLAGGYTSNDRGTAQIFGTREVWRYDVASDSYSRLPDLPVERAAGQLEYLDGKLYYFGGTNLPRNKDTPELYILDLAGGATSWQEGAPLPNARNHMGSAVLGGKIYAIGGQHDHDKQLVTQADVHAYDPATNRWQQRASLPLAVSHIANSSFTMGGRIIVIGGETSDHKAVDNVVAYDPRANSWTQLTPLPLGLLSEVAKNVNGQIIVTGGSGNGWHAETYLGTPVP